MAEAQIEGCSLWKAKKGQEAASSSSLLTIPSDLSFRSVNTATLSCFKPPSWRQFAKAATGSWFCVFEGGGLHGSLTLQTHLPFMSSLVTELEQLFFSCRNHLGIYLWKRWI